TVLCTSSADAPGKVAAMAMAGGAMLGYCEMGRVLMASAPASMTTMASTQAKIGRSMKKLTMARAYSAADGGVAPACRTVFSVGGGLYSSATTLVPGFADWIPSTMTRSPAFSPAFTTH